MPYQNKPTRGKPLTEAERAVKRAPDCPQKGWQAGARFHWVSKFGSSVTNTGKRPPGKTKMKLGTYVPPTKTPRWARKYRAVVV